jgi:hypothetical protein
MGDVHDYMPFIKSSKPFDTFMMATVFNIKSAYQIFLKNQTGRGAITNLSKIID